MQSIFGYEAANPSLAGKRWYLNTYNEKIWGFDFNTVREVTKKR